MHVEYASRQVAYPPPIFDTSSNTAVARAVAARDIVATEEALRAGDTTEWLIALRTTLEEAARDVAASGRVLVATTVCRAALRAVAVDVADALLVAVRAAVADGRADTTFVAVLGRSGRCRCSAAHIAPLGTLWRHICSGCTARIRRSSSMQLRRAKNRRQSKKKTTKFFSAHAQTYISLVILYHFLWV